MTIYEAPIRVATAVLRRPDGRMLFTLRRATEKNYPSHWEFPGGKVDVGENIDQALRREVYEEVGYNMYADNREPFADAVFSCNGKLYHMYGFVEEVDGGWMPSLLESDGAVWLSLPEARRLLNDGWSGDNNGWPATEATLWLLGRLEAK